MPPLLERLAVSSHHRASFLSMTVIRFRGGKIAEIWNIQDRATLQTQLHSPAERVGTGSATSRSARNTMTTAIVQDDVRRLPKAGAQQVDVFPTKEYHDLHLPGAISIPLKELTEETTAGLRKDAPVAVISKTSG